MGILNRNGIQRMGEIFNISRRKGAKLGPLFKNFVPWCTSPTGISRSMKFINFIYFRGQSVKSIYLSMRLINLICFCSQSVTKLFNVEFLFSQGIWYLVRHWFARRDYLCKSRYYWPYISSNFTQSNSSKFSFWHFFTLE